MIVMVYRKNAKTPIFASKSLWFKLFDFTFNYDQSEVLYFKYPFAFHYLNDTDIINRLFKYHRSDPASIFKGNNNMIRFVEIIQCMYPESNININDCILTSDATYTKIYHQFLRKYLGHQTLSKRTNIIENNIIKYFGDLDAQQLDLDTRIDKYVCDNFTQLLFDKTYTDTNISFSNCCSKINQYLFKNRMNVITTSLYTENNHELRDVIKNFRLIVDCIIEENKDIFDQEKFTLAQRQTMVPILLFAGQETTHVLTSYAIYLLSKHQNKIRSKISKPDADLDAIINEYFNMALADSTPAYGISRVLRSDIMITKEKKSRLYRNGTVIGFMPSHLAKLDKDKSIQDYNIFLPFGAGKHRCPGEHLVLLEVKLLMKYILKNYDISTDIDKIYFTQYFTQKISNKFLTTFDYRK